MKITKIEIKKTKTDKPYKSLELDDNRKFNVFLGHSRYEELAVGSEVADTDLVKDGQYWNLQDNKPKSGGNFKTQQVEKMMDKKAGFIKEAAKEREDSIKMAGSARDATLIITTFYPELADNPDKETIIKEKWTEWRKWLKESSDVPFV